MVEGLYAAATDVVNNIIQPKELFNTGDYYIKAGVVSPDANAMCVNMAYDELAPLVYTQRPNSKTNITEYGDKRIGYDKWYEDVPRMAEDEYLNRTVVDDVFKWGAKYQRRPPVFRLVCASTSCSRLVLALASIENREA